MSAATKLVHISDLHFGPHYQTSVGRAVLELLEESHPDAIVVSGDFTQRAKQREFFAARSFIDSFPASAQCLFVPGNHDIPLYRIVERLFSPYTLYRKFVDDSLCPCLQLEGGTLFGFNSTSPLRRITDGLLTEDDLLRCKRCFTQTQTDGFRGIVVHHHLLPVPGSPPGGVLKNARFFLEYLIDLNIDILFSGHQHISFVGSTMDAYPELGQSGIIISQCGTSTSSRGRGAEQSKNSCNRISIEPERITIEQLLYESTAQGFQVQSEHRFERR